MSKIVLTSNWHLGKLLHGNRSYKLIKRYFTNIFIPTLNGLDGDVHLFIMGDVFCDTKNIDTDYLMLFDDILNSLSDNITINLFAVEKNILNIFSAKKNVNLYITSNRFIIDKYLIDVYLNSSIEDELKIDGFTNFLITKDSVDLKYKKTFTFSSHDVIKSSNSINISSPFQIEATESHIKGFFILDTSDNSIKFNKNDITPVFKNIYVNNEVELNSVINNKKDNEIITLIVKEVNVIDNKKFKKDIENIKLTGDISDVKYEANDIKYDNTNVEVDYVDIINSTNSSYIKMLTDYIKNSIDESEQKSILDELDIVFEKINQLN